MWPYPADRWPPVLFSFLHRSSGVPTSTLPSPSSSDPAWRSDSHCHTHTAHWVPPGQPALVLGSSLPILEAGVCLCTSSLPTPPSQKVPHTHYSQHQMTFSEQQGYKGADTQGCGGIMWASLHPTQNIFMHSCNCLLIPAHLNPEHTQRGKAMSTAMRNTKTKIKDRVFSTHTGPRKMGWRCELGSSGVGRKTGARASFSSPQRRKISQKDCWRVF